MIKIRPPQYDENGRMIDTGDPEPMPICDPVTYEDIGYIDPATQEKVIMKQRAITRSAETPTKRINETALESASKLRQLVRNFEFRAGRENSLKSLSRRLDDLDELQKLINDAREKIGKRYNVIADKLSKKS